MARARVGVCALVTVCLCLLPGTSPAQALSTWGFAIENGDVNGDQDRDVSDGVYLLANLFLGGPAPVPLAYCASAVPPVANGDSNGDGYLDVSDPVRLLSWLYVGGVEPVHACGDGLGAGKAKGVPRVAPPNSNAFGKSLREWLTIYWRWGYGGGSSSVGPVELLPLPAGNDGGTDPGTGLQIWRGEIDVEYGPGTPFVLPEYAWILERYDGYPDEADDSCFDDTLIKGSVTNMSLTIDGTVVINDANKDTFYVSCTPFDPIVPYAAPSSYGSVAAIAWQGVGFVSPPLPPGDHVIHLYEEWRLPPYVAVIYDNTWNVHVAP